MTNTKTLLSLIGTVLLAVLVYSVWSAVMQSSVIKHNQDSGTVCTTDAMQCADGSWVGRTGPDCKFICPAGQQEGNGGATSEAKLNEKVTMIAESISPLEIIEDSRCPVDVQCIQAGTVRVKVRIESGMGIATEIFRLGDTITTETEAITLVAVKPEPVSGSQIRGEDYRFVFTSVKR